MVAINNDNFINEPVWGYANNAATLEPGATKWKQMVTGGKTLFTGPTPGGWLGVRALWNGLGSYYNRNECK